VDFPVFLELLNCSVNTKIVTFCRSTDDLSCIITHEYLRKCVLLLCTYMHKIQLVYSIIQGLYFLIDLLDIPSITDRKVLKVYCFKAANAFFKFISVYFIYLCIIQI
jgi:hypothetical protein